MDLIASLAGFPKAGTSRVAVVGHSQGGGVSQIPDGVRPTDQGLVGSDLAQAVYAEEAWIRAAFGM